LNVLYIADIVGDPGFRATRQSLETMRQKHSIDLTIANGENRVSGRGLSMRTAQELFELGIDVITSGNHIWNRKESERLLEHDHPVLRPYNYPPGCPGRGLCTVPVKDTIAGIINLQGRSFLYPIDCPFRGADSAVSALNRLGARIIVIDMHAEATAEKIALGWYLDGKVSAVIGSHTHVQTADERILPGGTAYITDAGMTGPFHSVIGMHKETAIERFLTQLPVHYKIAEEDLRFCGVVVRIQTKTGRAQSIERFQEICNDTA
jgi:metallophosphoesterase (TIGR00282 family)